MQAMFPQSNSQPALYGLGISDVAFASQPFASSHSLTDLNGGDASSPEAFRHNIHLVHQQVARIQGLASSALAEMCVCRLVSGVRTLKHPGLRSQSTCVSARQGPHDRYAHCFSEEDATDIWRSLESLYDGSKGGIAAAHRGLAPVRRRRSPGARCGGRPAH